MSSHEIFEVFGGLCGMVPRNHDWTNVSPLQNSTAMYIKHIVLFCVKVNFNDVLSIRREFIEALLFLLKNYLFSLTTNKETNG